MTTVSGEAFTVPVTLSDGTVVLRLSGEAFSVLATMTDAAVAVHLSGEAFTASAVMDDDGFPKMAPMLALQVLDPSLIQAPTSATVVVAGAPAGATLDFTIDDTPVYSTTADSDGYLGPTSIPVPEPLGQGDHTVTVSTAGARLASATITLKRDPSPALRVVGPDADPVEVPGAITASGIRRWVLQDLMPGGLGSWVMPSNPSQMTPPHYERTLTPKATTTVAGVYHVSEPGEEVRQWTFSGYCGTKEMHDQLLAYGALNRRFYVIDHRGRAWKTTFTGVEMVARKRQADDDGTWNDWAHDYTVQALIYDQDWRSPQ